MTDRLGDRLHLKQTINLPRTGFKMKANLPNLEPRMLQKWKALDIYERIRERRQGQPAFILHDGPPYANGHIHLGHALNKILKDLIIKSKTMEGLNAPYVPGWDCHGLPIEIKVLGGKKPAGDLLKVRRQCRRYAQKFVNIQRQEFKRLGIFAQWDRPYLTMDSAYEAATVRELGHFITTGNVFRGLKPVHWCISCETALAEAEVEYADHTSPSIYVKFPLQGDPTQLRKELAGKTLSVLIWTTTPWTLPANLAICFHPDFRYALLESGSDVYLLAEELVEAVSVPCSLKNYRLLGTVLGRELEGLVFRHAWLDRESKAILGRHVTLDQGTGAVHTAPGHGHDDYVVGKQNGLPIYNPVNADGVFKPEVEHFASLNVFEANPKINKFMRDRQILLAEEEIIHSYPHCWRCHKPVIFRATPQWFINMDHARLRQRSLEAIQQVQWIPTWGKERIGGMIATRPDWCISRQRTWGVPIPVFYCQQCQEPLLEKAVVRRVAEIFEESGADAWYFKTVSQLLPEDTACRACGGETFEKEFDILDVWFDSGVSHAVVLGHRPDLPWPADVYLEGGDQYRGWFHSSLLVAVGTRNAPPYRTVICNGWTLDRDGQAMSKSLGNVISPLEVIKDSGAEILRLWVASITYTEDVRLSEEILARLREAYRKIRNTQRFLLGNLWNFVPEVDSVQQLEELDRWALARTAWVAQRCQQAYRRFDFHVVYRTLYSFLIVDLSSFYLDVLKDRLYISPQRSQSRRAAQTALFLITDTVVRLLAPILPFTSEEVWENLYEGKSLPHDSVHLAEFNTAIEAYRDDELLRRWEPLQTAREKVLKALEESRQSKLIGNSLEAKVTLRADAKTLALLRSFQGIRFLFLVSEIELVEAPGNLKVEVSLAGGTKCERCWHYRDSVGTDPEIPTVCGRCSRILHSEVRI